MNQKDIKHYEAQSRFFILMPPKKCWLERLSYIYFETNMKNNNMYKRFVQNSEFKHSFELMSMNLNQLVTPHRMSN